MAAYGNGSPPNGNGSPTRGSGSAMATVGHGAVNNQPATVDDQFVMALKCLDMDVGNAELHPRQKPGTLQRGDQQVTLNTNVYGLRSEEKQIHQYHLKLVKNFQRFKDGVKRDAAAGLVATKKDEDDVEQLVKFPDYTTFENRKNNRALVDALIAGNPEVFGRDPNIFLYDFANTLFSLEELDLSQNKMLVLDEKTVQSLIKRKFTLTCEVIATGSFSARKFEDNFSPNLEQHDAQAIRFLELATSRYASLHPEEHLMFESKQTTFMHPEKYDMKSPPLSAAGKILYGGASKMVQLVQGPSTAGSPAVIIDSKKTPFYTSMNLLQMISRDLNFNPNEKMTEAVYNAAEKYVKNLEVFPTYGDRQETPITLKGFAVGNATNNDMVYEGGKISLQEYYKRRHQRTLQFPALPLVAGARKVNGYNPLFPLELLWVADNQRVKNSNITSTDIATIVKSCAVPPVVKSNEIAKCHSSFAFGKDGFLAAAKIQVLDNPLKVDARILQAPTVNYASGPQVTPGPNGKWRIARDAKFLHTAQVPTWSAVLLNYGRDNVGMQEFKEFVGKFQREMNTRGIQFKPLANHDIIQVEATEHAVAKLMQDSDEGGYRFLLFGHPDKETHLHGYIKGMERKFGVITQCVKTRTIGNVLQNKMLSLENIVAKTNVKLGGINYNCIIPNAEIDPTILYIGLGMNHPGGGLGAPNVQNPAETNGKYHGPFSVLGFSANDGKIPNEFIGNFFLQPVNRDEKVTVLDSLVHEVLKRFIKNRGCAPSRVIFYRNGCSEGSFIKILRYEVPIVRAMVRDMAPHAKVSFIIPSKLHSVRLFNAQINPSARADEQNIRPGTVVDTAIVSMTFSEFYLNSHLALQGTAKSTKYTILYTDEEKTTLDQFERWTYALAYDFQIVSSPTSLPAPVYIANRYAERGRQIMNTFQTSEQANRKDELELVKKNGAVGNGNGHATVNGNGTTVSNGNGNSTAAGINRGCKVRIGETPGQLSAFYEKSTHFNFTNRADLRSKRVNA